MSSTTDTILEILSDVEEYRPLINAGVKALKSFGPEIDDLLRTMVFAAADIKMAVIQRYVDNGFTKEEAILLVLDSEASLQKSLNNINSNSNS
ncbi:hypothetical protein KAR91_76275 [Candidatus Pacearchaeota archaeon]|nr:hypothetical protein [Candidatus Pacearchaeota archaeon]